MYDLYIDFRKYLKAKGVFNFKTKSVEIIFMCINGKFVVIDTFKNLGDVQENKIKNSGGVVIEPMSLKELSLMLKTF